MRALGVTDCRWGNIQKHVHVVRKEVELGALSATVVAAAALPRPPVKRDRDRPAESERSGAARSGVAGAAHSSYGVVKLLLAGANYGTH